MTESKFFEITDYLSSLIAGTEFENKVYAVGGAIRSYLMGDLIKDIDLVIELPDGGVKLAEFLKETGKCSNIVIYPTFGTAMFHLNMFPDEEIECVMTRGEKYLDSGSRNPTVTFSPLNEDASRRDLTINALYYNISEKSIIDPTGYGKNDIANCIIRTPRDPNETFIDDPLRILRCVRFAERTNFTITDDVYSAMKKNIDRLSIISKERIRDEFVKILSHKMATKSIGVLMDIGAMKYIIPELIDTKGCTQNEYHFGDVYEHTMATIDYLYQNFGDINIEILLALLLHDIGKPRCKTIKDGKIHFYKHEEVGAEMCVPILKALKFDTKTIKEVAFLVKMHMRTKNFTNSLANIKVKSLNKLAYDCGTVERWIKLGAVIDCDNMSHAPEHCIEGHYRAMFAAIPMVKMMFGYKLPINGDDVMKHISIPPGENVKIILKRILSTAMGKPDITRTECFKLILTYWKQIKYEKKHKNINTGNHNK